MPDIANRRTRSRGSLLRRLRSTRVIVGLVALVLAVVFILENNQRVRIHFVFFTAHSRLWVGFLVSLVFGALLGQALFAYRRRRGGQPAERALQDKGAPGPAKK